MSEFERGLEKLDKAQIEDIEKLGTLLDKNACEYLVRRLMEEIDKKYGIIVDKPIFVEKKIEVLIPKYVTLDIKQVGLIRWLWRKVF